MALVPSELTELGPEGLLEQNFLDFLPENPEDNSSDAQGFPKPPADGQNVSTPVELALSSFEGGDSFEFSGLTSSASGLLRGGEFGGRSGSLSGDLQLALAASHKEGHTPGGGGGDGGGPGKGGGGGGDTGGTEPLTYYKAGGKDRGPNDVYNIEIDFLGQDWTLELQQAFIDAADFLTTLVTQGLADVLTTYPATGEIMKVDDLRFTAELLYGSDSDGAGGLLGFGGPYVYEDYSLMPREQPYIGLMAFDSADTGWLLGDGLWDDVVLHEMLHVMGVGTIWEPLGLVSDSANGLVFTGENALAQYLADYSDADLLDHGWTDANGNGSITDDVTGVPIQGGHLRESVFGEALMTPYLDTTDSAGNPLTELPLTNVTIASLADLGYSIDEGALLA